MSIHSPENTSYKGIPIPTDAFVVIVKTEWNAAIVDELEKGSEKILSDCNVPFKTIIVPGAFEIPFAIQNYISKCQQLPTAFIALGCVIRGDTPHFDYVCKAVTEGILHLNLTRNIPTIFGILTVENELQAKDRIGGAHGHKGEEAAITALKMMAISNSN